MGRMNVCVNESMNVSKSSSITYNPLNQQHFSLDQNHQHVNQINQIFSPSEQQKFNLENFISFENQLEHRHLTKFEQSCYACSTILEADMPCLQLSERDPFKMSRHKIKK